MKQGLLCDSEIMELCQGSRRMLDPFVPILVRKEGEKKVISYGLTSFGYDMRCEPDWRVFSNAHGEIIDPKDFSAKPLYDSQAESILIPPNSFVLTVSKEYFRMPPDVIGVCLGKSTYARCGVILNVTPLEPGWEGNLTIELSNSTPLPVRVYANEGIGQILFFRGSSPLTTYDARSGKYQGTKGIVLAKV